MSQQPQYQIRTNKWPFQRQSSVPEEGHAKLHNMSSHLDRHKGVDIASAAAIVPGNDGDYYHITGIVAITSIATRPPGDRILFKCVSGGLQFTHLTGTLNMRGKVDFTSIAGDIIEFVSDSTTEWTEIRRSESGGSLIVGFEVPDLQVEEVVVVDAAAKTEVAGQSFTVPDLTVAEVTSTTAAEDTT